jgi:hypothetical protein
MAYPKFEVLYYKVSPCTAKKMWDISSLKVKNLFELHHVNYEQ